MKVRMIDGVEKLEQCPPFFVDKLLWGTKSIPKTYGYLGFVPGDGLYLKMICEEKDPLRTCTKDRDPVYRDSAMEAFFMFESQHAKSGPPVYFNFEFNANGVLLAAYGKERTYRSYLAKEVYPEFQCKAEIEENQWSVSLRIPVSVLERVCGPLELREGSTFTCNFYKISENKDIEHYAAYAPIDSEIPSFHVPEFFETAEIVKED